MSPKGYPGTAARHGTASRYVNHACRCDECRAAWREYHREWSHKSGRTRPREEYTAERRARAEARDNHGTETRYKFGCRCADCLAANAAARARRRAVATPAKHGANAYKNGCRCDECRTAYREYSRAYRRSRAA